MANVRGRRQDSDRVFEEFVPSAAWTEDSSSHYLLVDLPGFQKEWLKLLVDDHNHIRVGGERQTENKIVHFEQTFKIPENSDINKVSGRYEGGVLYVVVPKLVKDEEREEKHEHDQEEHNEKHEHEHDQEEHNKKHEHEHDQEEHNKKHKHEHDLEQHNEKHEHHQEEHDGGGHIGHHGQNDDNKKVVEPVQKKKKKVVEEGAFHDAIAETWRVEGGLLGSLVEILSKNKGIVVAAVLAFSVGVLLSRKFQSYVGTES